MDLGAFSVSLNVKDIRKSLDFYQKLGFSEFGGNIEEKWVILKNGIVVIGLFENMIGKNCLTFSPGWDQEATELQHFTDVREIEKMLEERGMEFDSRIRKNTVGPGSFTISDPDGNAILFDQYV